MKLFIVFAAFCTVSTVSTAVLHTVPSVRHYPFAYTVQGNSLITPTQQQYLTQDELGQYAYGYSEPLSSKQETRFLDGITRGSYSYWDAAGKLQTVDYTADAEGFHVAATNLPKVIQTNNNNFRRSETTIAGNTNVNAIDVAAAHKDHLAANEKIKLRLAQIRSANTESAGIATNVRLLELPNTVADTANIANIANIADITTAKSLQLKRLEAAKLRNSLLSAHDATLSVPVPRVYAYAYPRVYAHGLLY